MPCRVNNIVLCIDSKSGQLYAEFRVSVILQLSYDADGDRDPVTGHLTKVEGGYFAYSHVR